MQVKRRTILSVAALALFALPFVWLPLFGWFKGWPYPALLPAAFTGQHWAALASNGLLRSLALSVGIAATAAALSTAIGFVVSRSVAYHRHSQRLLIFAYLPLMLSPVIFSVVLYYYFIILNLSGAVAGVIIAQLLVLVPYAILLFSSHWNHQLRQLEGLVATMGGSRWQTFAKVLIPISRQPLLLCAFQTFLISWFDFAIANYIGVGKVPTLTVAVYLYIKEANYFVAAIAGCLLIYPPLLLLLFNRLARPGLPLPQTTAAP